MPPRGAGEEAQPRRRRVFVSQVALEVIEELCYEMGLHRMEAMREYAVFLVTSGGEPLSHHVSERALLRGLDPERY